MGSFLRHCSITAASADGLASAAMLSVARASPSDMTHSCEHSIQCAAAFRLTGPGRKPSASLMGVNNTTWRV
jgi:hypothetical protein